MIVRPVKAEAFLAGSGIDQRDELFLKPIDSACVSFELVQIFGISDALGSVPDSDTPVSQAESYLARIFG